jgi:hypothetical protein
MLRIFCISVGLILINQASASVFVQPDCFRAENPGNCIAAGKIEKIYIYDTIQPRDVDLITFIATQLPQDALFPSVVLNSDGGNLVAAIGIGRLLRFRKASVITGDIFDPQNPAICYSACVVVAAGAVTRNLDVVGIHSGYYEEQKNEQKQYRSLSIETESRLHSYYLEMGINSEIIEIEKRTPFNEMTYFFFDPNAPLEGQKIYQLGFRMSAK